MSLSIRDCARADLQELTNIYNDVILTTTAVYSEEPVSVDDRIAWWEKRTREGWPTLVATDADEILGFGTFGEFRAWPGYCFTVEHSVHVRSDRRGRGIGTLLVAELIARACAMGKHVMVCGIDRDNLGSIRMHERLGFRTCGHLREVGFKFGRRLDLVFLQRFCSEPPVGE